MKGEELISIIVSAGNEEKYFDGCLESIINQTYKNTEIILIDDGTSKNSGNICDNYAKKDSRIRVVHKENSGVSSARNDSIAMASGEYLTFVDAEDMIHPDYLEIMYRDIIDNDADIVSCAVIHKKTNDNSSAFPNISEPEVEVVSGRKPIELAIFAHPFAQCAVGKLYRKSFLDDVEFAEEQELPDDSLFVFELILKRPILCIDNRGLYMVHDSSLQMSAVSGQKFYDMRAVADYKINETLKRYPEFIEFVECFDTNYALSVLSEMIPYYRKYNEIKKDCIDIIKNSRHYIPKTDMDKKLFFLVRNNLYNAYCFIKNLSNK